MALLALGACGGTLNLNVENADDLRDLCEKADPVERTIRVSIPAYTGECEWGQDGNMDIDMSNFGERNAANGLATARHEVRVQLDLPTDAVVCDVNFEFQVDPQVEPEMRYDDHMFFTFDDVILASSLADMVYEMPTTPGGLPTWDWGSIVGLPFAFEGAPTWCLGQDDGRAECTIPNPEERGALLMDFDDSLVAELAVRAAQQDRYEFGFMVFGDNDPQTDCQHDAFEFDVDVPVVEQ
jgi:hypothetical protein